MGGSQSQTRKRQVQRTAAPRPRARGRRILPGTRVLCAAPGDPYYYRRLGAVNLVRERGGPLARARGRAAPRDGSAAGAWRRPRAPPAATAYGERVIGDDGGGARTGVRRLGDEYPCGRRHGGPRADVHAG